MASEWATLTLSEAGVVLLDCVHKTPPAQSEGYPYVAIPEMKGGRLDLDAARRISLTDFGIWTRKARPQAHDVVLSRRCNPGETAYVSPDKTEFALGQNLVLLRSDGVYVYPPFLRWLARGPEWWDQIRTHLNVGAVFDSLKCGDVPNFRVTIPPCDDQRAIVNILGSLDDKIELNRRMNGLLERMARAIFKAWFIDFEPVQAKAAGAAGFPGMPQPVFDQLPAAFVNSELGAIPEGWETAPLESLFDINPPRPLRKGDLAPYLAMADMPTHGHAPERWEARAYGSGMRFQNGDTLVARITPCLENGKTAFVDFLPDGKTGWGSTEYIVMRPRPPFPETYAYCLARTAVFRDFAISNMTGTSGRQRVPAAALKQYIAVRPDADTLTHFGNLVSPLFAAVTANMNENRALASIRDALLPKLISGEISAARVVEGAA